VFYAPELAQGFGLSGTLGLGGFSNGEAQKAGFAFPHYNTSRLFIRQTFGFGGEQETIEEDQTHFGGKVDVSRLSFTAGRLFLPDFIDNNAYADEPRTGFLNWAIWARERSIFQPINLAIAGAHSRNSIKKTGLFARAIC
jgi:high affinity Mn2+ porin